MPSPKPILPEFIKPMLGRLTRRPFDSPDYVFELKWDGWRALAFVEQDGSFRLVSRNGKDMTSQFPELEAIAAQVKGRPAVIDGEIVCLDESNRPSFSRLQQRMQTKRPSLRRTHPVNFIAFDILYDRGRDVMREPLLARKARLGKALEATELAQPCQFVENDGTAFFQATCDLGLEGIMAKSKNSIYVPGQRNPQWLKVKRVRESEFVVAGYSFGGARKELFSSLLLGLYDSERCLTYVGSVGTGFSEPQAKEIFDVLRESHVDDRPFVNAPDVKRLVHWCEPKMVCQVEYGEFTVDGKLRYPIFLRLRDDKAPMDCTVNDAPGWPRGDAIAAV